MKLIRVFVIAIVAMQIGACATVTITEKGTAKLAKNPDFEDSQSFFLWGLAGESHIDVKDVCEGKGASQLQTQRTFVDGLLTLITIGIYSPRTAKVWCQG